MAAGTNHSEFGAQENKVGHCFPIYLPWNEWTRCQDLNFFNVFKTAFSLSSFTFIKGHFSFSLLSAIRVVSSAYLRLLIFLQEILILACASSSPTFYMMYPAGWQYTALTYPFPDLEPGCGSMSGSISSWPAYRFLRSQVKWPGILISLRLLHSFLWSIQSKALA